MTLVFTLFVAGLVLLGFEVFVPGGILGVIGGLALLAGCALAFVEFGATGGWLSVGAVIITVTLMLWFEFGLLPKTALGRRLFLHRSMGGRSQPPLADAASVVGRAAVALTALSPSGYVEVDGRRYEAFCRSGFVVKGDRLTVVGVDNFRLIVQKPE